MCRPDLGRFLDVRASTLHRALRSVGHMNNRLLLATAVAGALVIGGAAFAVNAATLSNASFTDHIFGTSTPTPEPSETSEVGEHSTATPTPEPSETSEPSESGEHSSASPTPEPGDDSAGEHAGDDNGTDGAGHDAGDDHGGFPTSAPTGIPVSGDDHGSDSNTGHGSDH